MSDGVAASTSLLSGPDMPTVGLGTYPMDHGAVERVVAEALRVGYRLIDTAENYRNEEGVGRAIRASGVARNELFVTTKFNVKWHGEELVREVCERSLERLQLDVLDLLLIHWPNPQQDRYVGAWRGLIGLREAGLVRAIGVSNFKPTHLKRLVDETGVAPDVNQIELNPYVARKELRAVNASYGTVTEAWAPISKGGELLNDPAVTAVAQRVGRSPAQVVLRWHLQHSHVVIPKTENVSRLRENFALFDFALDDEQMRALDGLDRGEGAAVDADEFGH